jgi:hypothetical protein
MPPCRNKATLTTLTIKGLKSVAGRALNGHHTVPF